MPQPGFWKTVTSHLLALSLFSFSAALATPITYVDADFEGGATDFGGGAVFPGFDAPTNVSPSNLDGRALEFANSGDFGSQMQWNRGALPESTIHRVSFDYFAEEGANLTQFLDVPSILRLDVSAPGQHHVDVRYDLSAQTANAFLDGVLDNSLLTILAFPLTPISNDIRIGNQIAAPGNSTGVFQLDNLLWQGFEVPEPGTLALAILALLGGVAHRRRRTRPRS